MLNNKGQVLVVFIILLPLVLLVFSLIVDLSFLYNEKRVIDNNIKSAIKYGLDNNQDNNLKFKINKLLKENIDDIDSLYIDIKENKIEITLIKKYKSIFRIVNLKKSYEIKTTYAGYKQNDKIEIMKE